MGMEDSVTTNLLTWCCKNDHKEINITLSILRWLWFISDFAIILYVQWCNYNYFFCTIFLFFSAQSITTYSNHCKIIQITPKWDENMYKNSALNHEHSLKKCLIHTCSSFPCFVAIPWEKWQVQPLNVEFL